MRSRGILAKFLAADRLCWWIPGLVLLELLFVVWFFKYLPMVDLPQHILTANVLTHYDDPLLGYDQFLTRRFPWGPYSSYFWFVMVLEPVLGVTGATRLYLSLALVLTIVAFYTWLRVSSPGSVPQAIPGTLLLTGLIFYLGLVNYLFSIPFLFFSLTLSLQLGQSEHRVRQRQALLALVLLALYFSHVVTFMVSLVIIGIQQLVICRAKGLVRVMGASLPAAIGMGVWVAYGLSNDVSGLSFSYDPFVERLHYFLHPFNIFVDFMTREWVFLPQTLLFWIVFALAVMIGRGRPKAPGRSAVLVALLLCLSTLVVPSLIANSVAAFRLSYPAAFALLSLVPTGWYSKPVLRWIVISVCLLNPLYLIPKMMTFQAEMAGLEEIVAAIPPRQVVQPVITEMHSAEFRTFPFLHAGTWYNFYKGGTNPYLFAAVAHFPIRQREDFVPNLPRGMPEFSYETHSAGTDYFLVRTRRTDIIEDLSRHVPLAARSGDWMAFGPNPRERPPSDQAASY